MQRVLFRPFDFGKWIVLAFCAWVAGILDGIGGGRIRNHDFRPGTHAVDPRALFDAVREALSQTHHEIHGVLSRWPVTVLLTIAIPLALGVLLLLVWLSSRFKFVYLDNLVRNRAEITEPWHRLGILGDSLFAWRLGFAAATLLAVVLLALFYGGFGILTGQAHWPSAIPLIVIAVLVTLVLAVALAYTWLFLESFVVPIMYRFNLTTGAAWQQFLTWFAADSSRFLLYGLFLLALLIPVAIGIVLVGLATCCVGFLLLALPYVGVLVLLPLHVTYRLLGVEFLAQFDPRLDLFAPDSAPRG